MIDSDICANRTGFAQHDQTELEGAQAALKRIRREAMARGLGGATSSMVFHAANPERARELQALVGGSTYLTEFSPSMGIHTGPGVVGVAWLRPASSER